MQISIDGLLGSAQQINNRGKFQGEEHKQQAVKTDTVSIGAKINSRLDSIESEIRDIQTSLTRSQIIKNGLDQLIEGSRSGANNAEQVLGQVTFNGAPALREFLAGDTDPSSFGEKLRRITESITADTGRLRKLQVEVGNILASNLAGQTRADALSAMMESIISARDSINPSQISNLNADAVMKLIR